MLKINSGNSLNLQVVLLLELFCKFPNHFLKKENNLHLYLFGGKIERNEVSKQKHWKFNIGINMR